MRNLLLASSLLAVHAAAAPAGSARLGPVLGAAFGPAPVPAVSVAGQAEKLEGAFLRLAAFSRRPDGSARRAEPALDVRVEGERVLVLMKEAGPALTKEDLLAIYGGEARRSSPRLRGLAEAAKLIGETGGFLHLDSKEGASTSIRVELVWRAPEGAPMLATAAAR